jgi:hypothetical protein
MAASKVLHKRDRLELFRSELVSSNATTCYKSAMEDFHQDNKKQLPASCLGLESTADERAHARFQSFVRQSQGNSGLFPERGAHREIGLHMHPTLYVR